MPDLSSFHCVSVIHDYSTLLLRFSELQLLEGSQEAVKGTDLSVIRYYYETAIALKHEDHID